MMAFLLRPTASLCSHLLFGLHKHSASIDGYQWMLFFPQWGIQWHTFTSDALSCQTHFLDCPSAVITAIQHNGTLAGRFNLYFHNTSICLWCRGPTGYSRKHYFQSSTHKLGGASFDAFSLKCEKAFSRAARILFVWFCLFLCKYTFLFWIIQTNTWCSDFWIQEPGDWNGILGRDLQRSLIPPSGTVVGMLSPGHMTRRCRCVRKGQEGLARPRKGAYISVSEAACKAVQANNTFFS